MSDLVQAGRGALGALENLLHLLRWPLKVIAIWVMAIWGAQLIWFPPEAFVSQSYWLLRFINDDLQGVVLIGLALLIALSIWVPWLKQHSLIKHMALGLAGNVIVSFGWSATSVLWGLSAPSFSVAWVGVGVLIVLSAVARADQ